MASLLRKIRENRWYDALSSRGEPLPADPLSDLNTRDNSLSVWQVLTDGANLEDVVVAITATYDHVDNIDVVLVDEEAIRELGITVEPTQGQSPLNHAMGYHRHLVHLQAQSLVKIADVMRHQGDFRQFSEREVGHLLGRYVGEGRLNAPDLKPQVRSHLERKNLIPPTSVA